MIDIAKFFDIPCVLTTSFDDGPNGPIVKEIGDALKDSPLIRRPGQINAMDNDDFVHAVKKTGRKQVVVRWDPSMSHESPRLTQVWRTAES
jgi:nicotinamidase-related amidase